jgi:hypothetical protein
MPRSRQRAGFYRPALEDTTDLMEIDREHVVALLREKGKDDRVQHAIDQLPEKIDHEKHAQHLEKLGIDPGELAQKAAHNLLG